MQNPQINFEWRVAAGGYEIAADRIEWFVDPQGRPDLPHEDKNGGPFIRPAGDGPPDYKPVRPLDLSPALFATFANLDRTPESCLWFAERYGLLYSPLTEATPHRWGERLKDWFDAMDELRWMIDVAPHLQVNDRPLAAAPLDMKIVRDPASRALVLQLVPSNLHRAMLVQFADTVASGTTFRACQQCRTVFTVGAHGRRRDALFCSDKCRVLFNYHKREAAKHAR